MERNPVRISSAGEIGRIIHDELLSPSCKNFVIVGDEQTCMPEHYLKHADAIKEFPAKPTDTWVVSYPQTGTTTIQEMVWRLCNDINCNSTNSATIRFPLFERCILKDYDEINRFLGINVHPPAFYSSINYCADICEPRFLQTHLPITLLPELVLRTIATAKVIYVMRNPLDVCISNCLYGNNELGWRTNVANFTKLFLADKVPYGSYWKHVLGYWELSRSRNVLCLRHEAIENDIESVINQVARFLGKDPTPEQIKHLAEYFTFERTSKSPDYELRWLQYNCRNRIAPEIVERFDKWNQECIKDSSHAQYLHY